MAVVFAEQRRRMAELQALCDLAAPDADEEAHMFAVWEAHASLVFAQSLRRESNPQVQLALSKLSRCRGCGATKVGHRKGRVHTKCSHAACWCGVPRLLHPFPLSAGVTCLGEWSEILSTARRGAGPPVAAPEAAAEAAEAAAAQ